ncbi:MAG: cation diffusion facilitator family transporter [Verrucomicrobiales bacterium]|jgi:cation diffusion facilitator family transporter|nr:cation diffusion facilitator family transporter [Verrucomicrobiales bacterium]
MNNSGGILKLGLLSVAANVALMLVKISVGFIGHSYALIADGIESAGDILTSVITWAGFKLSLRPADADHPYGHGKIESLAGLFASVSLFIAAGFIAHHAIQEIKQPHHAPAWFTLPVLVAVVVVKELLSRKLSAANRGLDSRAIQGDAWHHRADALTSAAAAVGITVALVGGAGWEPADDWAALAACVIIGFNGLLLCRAALHDLLDGSVAATVSAAIRRAALTVSGVGNVEKCRVRKSGIGLFVELHVEVDPAITVADGHRIAHRVKDHLQTQFPQVIDVLVHIEPSGPCPLLINLRE